MFFHGINMIIYFILLFRFAFVAGKETGAPRTEFTISSLTTEYLDCPLGIDTPNPRFSWQIDLLISSHSKPLRRGVSQRSFQIQISNSPTFQNGKLWDCGTVESSETTLVPLVAERCNGLILVSDSRYFWRVIVTLDDGSVTTGSSCFHTGLLSRDEWKADWITGGDIKNLLRSEFMAPKALSHATLFVSGIGYHEIFLDGIKVGDHRLDQGWTDYAKRIWYSTHDVTKHINRGQGNHALGAMLGNGWWSCGIPPGTGNTVCEDSPPQLLVQLQVDGKPILLSSADASKLNTWRVSAGPIVYNSLYHGEVFDSRVSENLHGWTSMGFDTKNWSLASPANSIANSSPLSSQLFEPIRHIASRTPLSVTSPSSGVQVFDFGQNQAAVVRLKRFICNRGTNITLRHGEALTHPPYGPKDGSLYVGNLRGAKATDTYICSGNPKGESYTPTFTQHGFRYVEISGLGYPLNEEDIEAIELHSDVRQTSSLLFSNSVLNKIQHAVVWGQKTNLMSVPTDCDQRDERKGWLGDAALVAEEAAYNFGMGAFYTHWLTQIVDAQADDGSVPEIVPALGRSHGAPNWESAYPVLLWVMLRHYGDKDIVLRHHHPLVRFFDYFESNYNKTGIKNFITGFGDWVPPPPHPKADYHLTGAFAFLYDLQLGAELFAASSHPDAPAQAHRCEALKRKLTQEYHAAFYNKTAGVYKSGLQTEQALPLTIGAVPEDVLPDLLSYLVKDIQVTNAGHTTCGIIGIKFLMEVLSNSGYGNVALDLALQTTYPSWGYMVDNENEPATTVWEKWNSDTDGPRMNSRNHIMFGSVSSWFYKFVAGITPMKPGYSHISIRPSPSVGHSNLTHVDARVATPHGHVLSSWKFEEQDDRKMALYTHSLTIPPNTKAVLAIPFTNALSSRTSPNGRNVQWQQQEEGWYANNNINITESGVSVWKEGKFVSGIPGIQSGKVVDDHVELHLSNGNFIFTSVLFSTTITNTTNGAMINKQQYETHRSNKPFIRLG